MLDGSSAVPRPRLLKKAEESFANICLISCSLRCAARCCDRFTQLNTRNAERERGRSHILRCSGAPYWIKVRTPMSLKLRCKVFGAHRRGLQRSERAMAGWPEAEQLRLRPRHGRHQEEPRMTRRIKRGFGEPDAQRVLAVSKEFQQKLRVWLA